MARDPGGGEPRVRREVRRGLGRERVTEGMGVGDVGVSLWGEWEEQDGMHLGARGFVHAELIEPETGEARRDGGGADRRARVHASPASCGAAAAIPHARSRRGAAGRLRMRPRGPTRALPRANRRHAHRSRGELLPLGRARSGERVRASGSAARSSSSRRRQACSGAATSRQRRARRGSRPGTPPSPRRSASECATYSSSRPRRARAVGEPPAQRIQVEARRAALETRRITWPRTPSTSSSRASTT